MSRHRALEQQEEEVEQELLCPCQALRGTQHPQHPELSKKWENPNLHQSLFLIPRGWQPGHSVGHHQGHQVTSGPPPLRAGTVPSQPRRILSPLPAAKFLEGFQTAWLQEHPVRSFIPGWGGWRIPELEFSLCNPTWPQGWVCVLLWMSPLPGDIEGAVPSPAWGKLGNLSSKNQEGFVYQDLHPEFCGGRESWMKPTAIAVTSENK